MCSNSFSYLNLELQTYQTGVAGFEPTNGGVKVRSLTTWRHPKRIEIKAYLKTIIIRILGKKGFEPLTP
jgi:hypothetical protein